MNPAVVDDPRLAQYQDTSGVAQAWLDAVWRQLRLAVPGLADRVSADDDLADAAGDIVIAATLRVLRNPEGNKSETASVDSYSEGYTKADSTLDVYFTAAELSRLQPSDQSYPVAFAGSVKYL